MKAAARIDHADFKMNAPDLIMMGQEMTRAGLAVMEINSPGIRIE